LANFLFVFPRGVLQQEALASADAGAESARQGARHEGNNMFFLRMFKKVHVKATTRHGTVPGTVWGYRYPFV